MKPPPPYTLDTVSEAPLTATNVYRVPYDQTVTQINERVFQASLTTMNV